MTPKGVPQDKRQLWDLLSLLAQLKEGSLSSILVQKIRNVGECSAVVLGHGAFALDVFLGMVRINAVHVAVGWHAAVVTLMGGICGGGGSGLGMLLVRGLLMNPSGLGVAILMTIKVWVGHHLGFFVDPRFSIGRSREKVAKECRIIELELGRQG